MSLRRVKGVIFDWAGTTVDYGCIGPLAVLTQIFGSLGLKLSREEARRDMGLLKNEHIRKILFSESIRSQFLSVHGREPDDNDFKAIWKAFEPEMKKIVPQYSELIPGTINAVHYLRKMQIKVGSTTGYTKDIMEALVPVAKKQGYDPDYWVSASEVSKGRPFPWMIFRNAEKLNIPQMPQLIKIGDTLSDIQEGRQAGAWSVGILEGSSLVGAGPDEVTRMSPDEFRRLKQHAREEYMREGADFVIESLNDIPKLIDEVNGKLAVGENPGNFVKLEQQPYKLFTPGPILTSRRVKLPMMVDWGSREADYLNLVQNLRNSLTSLVAGSQPELYTTTIMQGSGTFGVESVIASAMLQPRAKFLVLVNGQYGKRMAKIAKMRNIETVELEFDETSAVNVMRVKKELARRPDITHVGFVHCETTTGIVNPLKDLCALVKSKGKVLIVDAISSIGAIPLDASALDADFVVGSSNKGLQAVPGFAFIVSKREALAECKGISSSLSLDLYDQWEALEKGNGSFRFTSPVHAVRSLAEALKELEEEGGVKRRSKRYAKMQRTLQKGMEELGFKALALDGQQGPIITTFHAPQSEKWDFQKFYDSLKDKGCVIYPGKLTQQDTFRISTIGALTEDDVKDLLENVKASIFWQ